MDNASTLPPAPSPQSNAPTIVTILLLIFLPFWGMILMWFWPKWKTSVKVIITVVIVIWTIISTLLLISIFGLFGLAMSNPSKYINSTSTSTPTSTTTDAFKTAYKATFTQSCISSANGSVAGTAMCNCVADRLVTDYTPSQLTQIATKYKAGGQLPPEFASAITACTSVFPTP